MRNKKIKTFYNEKQVCFDSLKYSSISLSPLKPALLIKKILSGPYAEMIDIVDDFTPVSKEDFEIAHTVEYINNVYEREGNYNSNRLPWSQNLVDSLPYTTGSLYAASNFAVNNPSTVCFAPVSGMHHARPECGSGFCTFSGQVISAIKIYQETGMACAHLDLDGHFGNSIEDSRSFNPLLNLAIPPGCNINPEGTDERYVKCFEEHLKNLGELFKAQKIGYVVFAHGADSHDKDDLGGQMNTENWLSCATKFAEWVNRISEESGRLLPVVIALFGGYRKNNFDAVLNLHIKSLIQCSNIICRNNFTDNLMIN